MELKRKIYDELLTWKRENKADKAVVVDGLRQIGKTYIVLKFAQENYKNVYYFDFRKSEEHRNAFRGDFSLKEFIKTLNVIFEKPFSDEDAVLVFDELGDCPDARAAIKYILKETKFAIIATGSLLGVKGFSSRENRSPSVGFNHYIHMYPLDFEEFLWASNISKDLIEEVKSSVKNLEPLSDFTHNKMNKLFKSYVAVGGMPEAVITFLNTHDYYKAYLTNVDKLKELEGDFGRLLNKNGECIIDGNLLMRTQEVFNSMPSQLAKENTKFQFSLLRKGARAKEYELAINWLIDSGLVLSCHNLIDLGSPLSMYEMTDCYKLYFADTGLMFAKIGFQAIASLLNDSFSSAGGYLYENIGAETISKIGLPLYYSRNKESELDFIIDTIKGVSIVEIKMGNKQSKASRAVIEGKSKRKAVKCFKIRDANFAKGDYYNGYPHYAFEFLLEDIKKSYLKILSGNK